MVILTGYQTLTEIYSSFNTVIYRGLRQEDNQPVIIKTFKSLYPSLEDLTHLRQEYRVSQILSDIEGIVKSYALETYQNSLALILEDFGGESLSKYVEKHPLSLKEILLIARQLTVALGKIHQHQVIHKDIKPQNIIINPETQQVKITDFSIASCLTQENVTSIHPTLLEGTLAYISPEQTGRMNRAIDYRSDFYSLGVTLYEILTGEIPFRSSDPLELVHSHIAKTPLPPHQLNPHLPKVISDIVMKLLAKTAEDRYQSAEGLKFDLETCLMNLENLDRMSDFVPGNADRVGQLFIPQKLYGREVEVALLKAAFERVSGGNFPRISAKSEMMLVSGYSGIGKSVLVNEVHKLLVRQRGYFIVGKFDPFKRNIPYSSLIEAFQSLIRQILTESEAAILSWKEKILSEIGTQGQIIIDVIPDIELIIGPQPSVPQLGLTGSQNRFNRVFKQFMGVFTKQEHPLVMFLDDLQWADSASLKLIERLMTDANHQYLLLIGAYRENEVSSTHPWKQTLEKIEQAGAIVNQIVLEPLQLIHVQELLSDIFLNSQTDIRRNPVDELAELLFNKTQGNPFFLIQLIKSLYQENLLSYDFQTQAWQWNLEQIQAIGITDKNVVELIARNIKKLPLATQAVLQLAACVGNQFNLEVLAIISEKWQAAIATDLWDALQAGLILPLSNDYKIPLGFSTGEETTVALTDVKVDYKFLHDRVQQAAYSLIPESEKQQTHLKIGQLLLQSTSDEERQDNIFALVNQLNFGAALLNSELSQYELAQLNLWAGQKAKAATAYEAAVKYCNMGLGLLPADSWQKEYNLTLTLYTETMEAEFLNLNFETTEVLADTILAQVMTPLDAVKVYEIKMQMYTNLMQMPKAFATGFEALEKLGFSLSQIQVDRQLPLPQLEELDRHPEMTDPYQLAALRLLMAITAPAFIAKPESLLPIILAQVHLCIQQGHSTLAAFSYAWYGTLLCGTLGDIDQGYHSGQLAIQLLDRFNAQSIQCQVYLLVNTFITPWKEHFREVLSPLEEGMQKGLEVGDLVYAGFCAENYCTYLFLLGDSLETIEQKQAGYVELMQSLKNEYMLSNLRIWRQLNANLQGLASERFSLIGQHLNETIALPQLQASQNAWSLFNFYLAKLILCYLLKDYENALTQAILGSEPVKYLEGMMAVGIYNFYHSLTLLKCYDRAATSDRATLLQQVEENQKQLQDWFHHAPMNYQHKYELVEAEKARVLGQPLAAEYYDRAIAGANRQGYFQEEALANELAAEYYLALGREKIAKTYMTDAYYGYIRWGATVKATDLEESYPHLIVRMPQLDNPAIADPYLTIASTTTVASDRILDLTAVMKASFAISGEIVLASLLEKLMNTVLENAGAQTGCLLLSQRDRWTIEATGTVDGNVQILGETPLETSQLVPLSMIQYVARTQTDIVLGDASQEELFSTDPYILQHQPKSVLCAPIISQGKVSAILYLENNLTAGAFTPERLAVLRLLSSQAAISLENARLYTNLEMANQQLENYNQTLERKVQERTQELEEKNACLQQEMQERQRAELAAQAASRAKSEFLANMSHEFRTPLNGILGYAQILKRDQKLTKQQQDGIRIIHQCGEHLLMLINDILDLSKIEAGKMEIQLSEFAFSDYLQSIAEICRIKAENKGISFIYEPISPLPIGVEGDEKKLRQVLLNLLGNALKFTETGGVTFKISCLSRNNLENPGTAKTVLCRFQVEDTGIGITAEHLSKIFLPFEQVGDSSHHTEGTGLGLTISRQLVELMGGELKVESTFGRGSTFWFELEMSEVDEWILARKASERIITGFRGERKKILVADDKWENRSVLLNLLQPLGFEMMEAINGQDCLMAAQQFEPDCILLDLVMPVMDGFEAARHIRQCSQLKNTVIIGTSASVFEAEQQSSFKAGCNAFIPKPIRSEDLLECLQNHLELTWIYEELHEPISPSFPPSVSLNTNDLEIIPPPPQIVEILLDLAMKGDLKGIQIQAKQLSQLDVKYAPFANQLIKLAEEFEEGKLLAMVKNYWDKMSN